MSLNFSAREKKLLFILLLLIIAFLFWKVNICRLIPELKRARLDLELGKSTHFSARENTKKLPFLQALAADIKNEVQNAENIFWQQMEPASLLKALGRAGGKDLQVTSVKPLEEKSSGLRENEGEEGKEQPYLERDFEIEVRGSYGAVLEFIHKLEGEPSSRIYYLYLQKDEGTSLVKALMVWKVYFLPREQKKETSLYDTNIFRQDLFAPEPVLQTGCDAANEGNSEEISEDITVDITETKIGEGNELPPEGGFNNEEEEPGFFYPDPYAFPFKD